MKEEQLFEARMKELASTAFGQNRYTFSQFLSAAELTQLYDMAEKLKGTDYDTFGGSEACERQMVRFGSERMFGYEEDYPIAMLKIVPVAEKFADNLSHRDYLGALMNLGLERDVLGDIFIRDKTAYVFCLDSIADYITANLERIKHTSVKVQMAGKEEAVKIEPKLVSMEVSASSCRFDAVAAAVCKLSRSQVQSLFREKKVLLSGRICENYSMILKEDAVFSLRGYGKFVFKGCKGQSKKGRLYIELLRYE